MLSSGQWSCTQPWLMVVTKGSDAQVTRQRCSFSARRGSMSDFVLPCGTPDSGPEETKRAGRGNDAQNRRDVWEALTATVTSLSGDCRGVQDLLLLRSTRSCEIKHLQGCRSDRVVEIHLHRPHGGSRLPNAIYLEGNQHEPANLGALLDSRHTWRRPRRAGKQTSAASSHCLHVTSPSSACHLQAIPQRSLRAML